MTSADRVQAPAAKSVLQAGAVIPAALLTGLRSDLPGQITAQVTEAVYDSPTGKILLIPQGARLIGQYDAQVAFGQNRALLVWNRVVMPNGRSIVLERQPGADPEGYAGLEDQVDNHWGALFKAALLSTILVVGSEAGTSNDENSSRGRDPARRVGLHQPDRPASGRAFAAGSADDHRAARVPGPRDRDTRPCDGALRGLTGETMSKLKLGAIADDKPVRVTHDLPPAVHRDLVAYAEALARETGAVVEPVKLIAPMLERFMATDRAFSKARRTLPAAPATAMGASHGAPRPAGEPNSESA